MGKVFMILLFVLGIWMATQFAAGTSPFSQSESRSEQASVASKSGDKVRAAYDHYHGRPAERLAD